jgi:hypothetical protein
MYAFKFQFFCLVTKSTAVEVAPANDITNGLTIYDDSILSVPQGAQFQLRNLSDHAPAEFIIFQSQLRVRPFNLLHHPD